MLTRMRLPAFLQTITRDLSPAYFAMVMATGIVSIAAHMRGLVLVGCALFYLNVLFYIVLWLLYGARIVWFPRRFLADIFDDARGPGYFTWIAASAVIGSQCLVFAHAYQVAAALFVIAGLLWLGLTYAIFTALAVKKSKPALGEGINSGWLIAVVATQSIAVLSAHLDATGSQPFSVDLNFMALALWVVGGMLYIWLSTLIIYRYYFFDLEPADLTPTCWINMGATAISTLAGSLLIANSAHAPWLHSLRPFLEGFTIFYWATGTWWIPLLVLLGVWRHIIRRFPLVYEPLYWGLVFPLGMYAAATNDMAHSMNLAFLRFIPEVFLYIALLAWAVTLAGLVCHLAGQFGPLESRPRG